MNSTPSAQIKMKVHSLTSTDDHTVTTDVDLESMADNIDQRDIDHISDTAIQVYNEETATLVDKIIIEKFINNIIASTKDLVFVYIVLKKCFNCGLLTNSQYQNHVLESFAQTSIMIDITESKKDIQIEKQKKHFNYLLKRCPFISEAEFKSFLEQKLKNMEKNDMDLVKNENKAGDQITTGHLKSSERNDDFFMAEIFYTMMTMSQKNESTDIINSHINAFCSIASLIYNSIHTDCPTEMDCIDCVFSETPETSSTPSQVCQIVDFGNKAHIESVTKSVTFGFESVIGSKLSRNMEYIDNLDLCSILNDEDVTLSMSHFINFDEDDDFYRPMETAMKLKMTMINVVLMKLDDRHEKEDIESIVKIMQEHPGIASIQEKGCEKLADLVLKKKGNKSSEFRYEESHGVTNVLVEAMTNHRDILNVQTLAFDIINHIRIAVLRQSTRSTIVPSNKNSENGLYGETCCMSTVCRIFCSKN